MLTMSAGLDWDEWRPVDAKSTYFQMQPSRDAVQFVLDRKMTSNPGDRWNYSEGLFNLVSTIVSQTSQMSVPAFAQKYLFDPIGVSEVHWRLNPGGGYAVALTRRDAAKFGFLFLNQGAWDYESTIMMDLLANGLARQMVFRFADDDSTMWLKGSRGESERIPGQASAGNP